MEHNAEFDRYDWLLEWDGGSDYLVGLTSHEAWNVFYSRMSAHKNLRLTKMGRSL